MSTFHLELLKLTRIERDTVTMVVELKSPLLGDQASLEVSIRETEQVLVHLRDDGLVIRTANNGWLITRSGLEVLRNAGVAHRTPEEDGGFPELWDQINRNYDLDSAIAELSALPRTDPFWIGTNGRATPMKVLEWYRMRLVEDPTNRRIRWYLIGNSVGNDLGFLELFRPLVKEDPSNLRWMIEGCKYTELCTGSLVSDKLRPILGELAKQPAVAAYLGSSNPAPADRFTIDAAKHVLAGGDLFDT